MARMNQGRGHALGGGVVAGLVGGAALALVMLIAALIQGHDIWIGMKGAAAPFLHERAMQPGFDATAVALGVVCHFAVSIVWGVLFAAVWYGLSRGVTIGAGAVWGIVVWLAMYYVVLPVAGLSQMAHETPVGMAILSHLIFGLVVAVSFLPYQRTRPRAASSVSHIAI
jgi:uncharacterized membrane protein YagU involved in acid resistance